MHNAGRNPSADIIRYGNSEQDTRKGRKGLSCKPQSDLLQSWHVWFMWHCMSAVCLSFCLSVRSGNHGMGANWAMDVCDPKV